MHRISYIAMEMASLSMVSDEERWYGRRVLVTDSQRADEIAIAHGRRVTPEGRGFPPPVDMRDS